MSHATATISMHAGESLPVTVTITDDGTANGTPVDLTDAEVLFLVSLGYGGAPIIEKDSEVDGGILVETPANGVCVITLEPDDTVDLAGLYVYTVRATLGDDSEIVPLTGRLLVERTTAPAVP